MSCTRAGSFSQVQLHPVGLSAHAGRTCVCIWDCCRVLWPLQHTGYSNVACGPLLASCSIAASSSLFLTLPILFPSCVVFSLLQTEFHFTCSSCFSQAQDCESVVTDCTFLHTHLWAWHYLWISAKVPTLLSQMPLPEHGKRCWGRQILAGNTPKEGISCQALCPTVVACFVIFFLNELVACWFSALMS